MRALEEEIEDLQFAEMKGCGLDKKALVFKL